MFRNRLTRIAQFSLMIGAGFLAGCARPGDVNGTVTYQGKPVLSGSVTMIASDSMSYATTIKEDGTYAIPKVPAGPVKISVMSPNLGNRSAIPQGFKLPIEGDNPAPKMAAPTGPPGWFEIPEKYSDPLNSGLTGTVRAPKTNIDLKLD